MRTSARLAAADRDAVIKSERNAQTIVARTEIGSARGNTNGDLLHSYAADTRPLIRRRERDRGSVATPRFPATHPLRHTSFEIPLEHRHKMITGWIDPCLLRDFQ